MITTINSNGSDYRALFDKASDILCGYQTTQTYSNDVAEYFYKKDNPEDANDLFHLIEGLAGSGLVAFSRALEEYKVIYVKVLDLDGNWIGAQEDYDPLAGITTLEEYFSWLKALGNIDRKYTVLPLDEPHFEINANTRAISIPADFKKNGLAVQGDDLAEVVYFEIDRYFDYMDLNNCDIYIQWETPKGPDGKTVKSASAAYIRDIESKHGKLIFGWAISDVITKYSGNLKFSVRFFQWTDEASGTVTDGVVAGGNVAYNFNTLTATVPIQTGLSFSLKDPYELDDAGDRLVERLKDSVIVGGYEAAVPSYLINLAEDSVENMGNVNKRGYDLDENGEYKLKVWASTSDTGSISYSWTYMGLDENNEPIQNIIEHPEVVNEFVVATNEDFTKYGKNVNYFTKADNDNYLMYYGTIPPTADQVNKGLVLYTKQATCKATKAGIYWAKATNRVTNHSRSAESDRAIFYRPDEVMISSNPPKSEIIELDGCEISAIASNLDGTVSYQWQKSSNKEQNFGDGSDMDFVDIEGANGMILTISDDSATGEGHYRAVIKNIRNNAEISDTSSICRVTLPPEVPEISLPTPGSRELTYGVNALSELNCPHVEIITDNVFSDQYKVDWYMYSDNLPAELGYSAKITQEPLLVLPNSLDDYVSYFNPNDYADVITTLDPNGTLEGFYYPVVINVVNGREAATEKMTDTNAMFLIYS